MSPQPGGLRRSTQTTPHRKKVAGAASMVGLIACVLATQIQPRRLPVVSRRWRSQDSKSYTVAEIRR
jgi:hypothetical protein